MLQHNYNVMEETSYHHNLPRISTQILKGIKQSGFEVEGMELGKRR